jgi:uncharacterized membrane protein
MDAQALIAKAVGLVLLILTIRSIYKHFKEQHRARAQSQKEAQSVSEMVLNNMLLYAWLAFMLVFSGGMILNN